MDPDEPTPLPDRSIYFPSSSNSMEPNGGPDVCDMFMVAYLEQQQNEVELAMDIQATMNETIIFQEQARLRNERVNRVVHHREYLNRDRQEGDRIIHRHYFQVPKCMYGSRQFRQRYRMERPLFLHILNGVQSVDSYFHQLPDCTGTLGLTGYQKMTAALRMMAHNLPADATDEYVRIGTTTAIESMKKFCRAIIYKFGDEFLRRPNAGDVERLLNENEERGFPGMLGSIDCMHWQWRNCPSAWKGQYVGHCGPHPTVILEAVADKYGWFWHANFGMTGSLNDLNVFDGTNLFNQVLSGVAPPCNYVINNRNYKMCYYLGDGIYPEIATIVKGVSRRTLRPGTPEAHFTKWQELVRKDVERAFGMLQARFGYIRQPCRYFRPTTLCQIMKACIILNNMIIQDERHKNLESPYTFLNACQHNPDAIGNQQLLNSTEVYNRIYSKTAHHQLQQELIAHINENYPGRHQLSV